MLGLASVLLSSRGDIRQRIVYLQRLLLCQGLCDAQEIRRKQVEPKRMAQQLASGNREWRPAVGICWWLPVAGRECAYRTKLDDIAMEHGPRVRKLVPDRCDDMFKVVQALAEIGPHRAIELGCLAQSLAFRS